LKFRHSSIATGQIARGGESYPIVNSIVDCPHAFGLESGLTPVDFSDLVLPVETLRDLFSSEPSWWHMLAPAVYAFVVERREQDRRRFIMYRAAFRRRQSTDAHVDWVIDRIPWRLNPAAKVALPRRASENGRTWKEEKRSALQTGLLLAIQSEQQPQQIRRGAQWWWTVTATGDKLDDIVPRRLTDRHYVEWLVKETINHAEAALELDEKEAALELDEKAKARSGGSRAVYIGRAVGEYQPRRRPVAGGPTVQQHLRASSPQERRILSLKRKGLSYREVASAVGTTPATVKTTMARIRKKNRRLDRPQ